MYQVYQVCQVYLVYQYQVYQVYQKDEDQISDVNYTSDVVFLYLDLKKIVSVFVPNRRFAHLFSLETHYKLSPWGVDRPTNPQDFFMEKF